MKPSSSSLSKTMKKTSKRSKLSKSATAAASSSSSSSAATSLQSSSQQQQQATVTTTTAHQEAATPTLVQDLPKEKAQHRSYAGFGPKSIKMIWEQHDISDTEITMEAYSGLAEDATYKLWETINTIKTYARHSGGSVTCELVSEVLKDSNCLPLIGAGESEWDKIEYDGAYFYNTDRVVELRDQYINETDGFKVYETDVVSTWNVDITKQQTFYEFITSLCNAIFFGNEKSYTYGLDIAANASQIGCSLKLILSKCNEILSYQQKFQIIERCLNFLKALSYNPYARHAECYEKFHKLSELLICLLLGTDEQAKSPPEVIFKVEKFKKVEKKVKIRVKKINKNAEKLEKKRRSIEIVKRYLENQRQVNQQKIKQQLLIQQQNILRQNMLKLNPQTFRKTYGAYLQVLATRNAAILKGRKLQQRGNQNNPHNQNHSSGTGTVAVAGSSGINLRDVAVKKKASRILKALKSAIAQKRLKNQESSTSSTPQRQIMGPPPTPPSLRKQVMGPPPPPLKRQIMGPPPPPLPRRQVMGPPPPPPPQIMGPPPPPPKRKIMGPPPQPPPKIVGPRLAPSQVMGPPPPPLQKKIMGPPPQPIPKTVGSRISPLQLKRTLLLQSQIMNSPSLKRKVLASASASQIKAMAASLALSRSLSQSLLAASSKSSTVTIPITSLKSPNNILSNIKIEPGIQQQKRGQILPPLSLLPSTSSVSPQLPPPTVTIKVEKPDNDEKKHDQNQHHHHHQHKQQQRQKEKPNEQNSISTLPLPQTKICDFKNVDLIVSTIGCIGGQFGYFHNASIYLIQKKMVLFFEDRNSISCDTDFYFISRFVRGLIALGGYAFREIIPFLDRIDPLNAPEWLCGDFNVAATFLKGRDDIFLYEWLEELCGDKLQPFLVYSFKYHHNLMIKLYKSFKKPEFEIKPKIILQKFEKKIQNENDKNIIITMYFPEMINFDISKLSKTVLLSSSNKKINFKPGKKYIEKENEEEKRKKLILLTDRSIINNKIIIGKRRIMKKLTSNKKKIVNLSNYCYLQI